MPTLTLRRLSWIIALLSFTLSAQAQDLHIKKSITVGGNFVSSTDTSIKGARERTVSQSPTGNTITLRQCDLKRTVTINEQTQTYFVAGDPQDDAAIKAAAMMSGSGQAADSGGYITETSSVTDTGERKTMYGYPARHLKAKVEVKSSDNACTQMNQQYEIDGWYADVSKDLAASCQQFLPPVRQNDGCSDRVIRKRSGSAKPGYPLSENVTLHNADGSTTQVGVLTSEISKAPLEKELFDIPAGYTEVKSMAELKTGPKPPAPAPATALAAPQAMQQPAQQAAQAAAQPPVAGKSKKKFGFGQILNPAAAVTSQTASVAQAAQMSKAGGAAAAMQGVSSVQNAAAAQGMAQNAAAMQSAAAMQGMGGAQNAAAMQAMAQAQGMQGMQGMGMQPGGAAMAAPQQLGPKAPGKIRIGIAPPDAQVGQGTNSGGDFSTPIRNAEVSLMSGPAIEIAALDSHIPMQLQAEAQQKQCDYIMYSAVTVKRGQSGGFGKFMKMGSMAANVTPVGMMAHTMGAAATAQAASMAASQMAQQQAVNQLAGFNGQIKSKDDVSVQYQLVATGQTAPVVQNALQGKAKSDGEDVLTPLLTQAATDVLTKVSKK